MCGGLFSTTSSTPSTSTSQNASVSASNFYADPRLQNFLTQYSNQYGNVPNFSVPASGYLQGAAATQQPVSGQYQPIYQGAGNIAQQGIDPASIQSYLSPYIQSVVDPTQRQFAYENSLAGSNLNAQLANAGALTGSQGTDAQAKLQTQEQIAQAPVIAGLYNTGYGQAEQMAQANRQAQLAALGQQAGAVAGETGANTALGNLGANIWGEQYANAIAPYTLSNQGATGLWQLGLLGGTSALQQGAASGQTSTTTTPPVAGSILGSLGLLGSLFGASGGAVPQAAADGGEVEGKAFGGPSLGMAPQPHVGGFPHAFGQGSGMLGQIGAGFHAMRGHVNSGRRPDMRGGVQIPPHMANLPGLRPGYGDGGDPAFSSWDAGPEGAPVFGDTSGGGGYGDIGNTPNTAMGNVGESPTSPTDPTVAQGNDSTNSFVNAMREANRRLQKGILSYRTATGANPYGYPINIHAADSLATQALNKGRQQQENDIRRAAIARETQVAASGGEMPRAGHAGEGTVGDTPADDLNQTLPPTPYELAGDQNTSDPVWERMRPYFGSDEDAKNALHNYVANLRNNQARQYASETDAIQGSDLISLANALPGDVPLDRRNQTAPISTHNNSRIAQATEQPAAAPAPANTYASPGSPRALTEQDVREVNEQVPKRTRIQPDPSQEPDRRSLFSHFLSGDFRANNWRPPGWAAAAMAASPVFGPVANQFNEQERLRQGAAGLTGLYNGQPTMAGQRFGPQLQTEEIAAERAAEGLRNQLLYNRQYGPTAAGKAAATPPYQMPQESSAAPAAPSQSGQAPQSATQPQQAAQQPLPGPEREAITRAVAQRAGSESPETQARLASNIMSYAQKNGIPPSEVINRFDKETPPPAQSMDPAIVDRVAQAIAPVIGAAKVAQAEPAQSQTPGQPPAGTSRSAGPASEGAQSRSALPPLQAAPPPQTPPPGTTQPTLLSPPPRVAMTPDDQETLQAIQNAQRQAAALSTFDPATGANMQHQIAEQLRTGQFPVPGKGFKAIPGFAENKARQDSLVELGKKKIDEGAKRYEQIRSEATAANDLKGNIEDFKRAMALYHSLGYHTGAWGDKIADAQAIAARFHLLPEDVVAPAQLMRKIGMKLATGFASGTPGFSRITQSELQGFQKSVASLDNVEKANQYILDAAQRSVDLKNFIAAGAEAYLDPQRNPNGPGYLDSHFDAWARGIEERSALRSVVEQANREPQAIAERAKEEAVHATAPPNQPTPMTKAEFLALKDGPIESGPFAGNIKIGDKVVPPEGPRGSITNPHPDVSGWGALYKSLPGDNEYAWHNGKLHQWKANSWGVHNYEPVPQTLQIGPNGKIMAVPTAPAAAPPAGKP